MYIDRDGLGGPTGTELQFRQLEQAEQWEIRNDLTTLCIDRTLLYSVLYQDFVEKVVVV